VRIEDIDAPRCVPGSAEMILQQLAACGLLPDDPPVHQSSRRALYAATLAQLELSGWAYPCGCTRREIEDVLDAASARQRRAERVYPGTCREGLHGKTARAMRMRTQRGNDDIVVRWIDRRLGARQQNLTREVGDFVLKRADGLWAYQLAVVVDDAAQRVTHVVRGADLADNTPRQIHLQRELGLATPAYLHTPLVLHSDGEKLSKGHGATAVERGVEAVQTALAALDLPVQQATLADTLAEAVVRWRERWPA
jgi:glutamyl-Q tRNA(Asp) synthetase